MTLRLEPATTLLPLVLVSRPLLSSPTSVAAQSWLRTPYQSRAKSIGLCAGKLPCPICPCTSAATRCTQMGVRWRAAAACGKALAIWTTCSTASSGLSCRSSRSRAFSSQLAPGATSLYRARRRGQLAYIYDLPLCPAPPPPPPGPGPQLRATLSVLVLLCAAAQQNQLCKIGAFTNPGGGFCGETKLERVHSYQSAISAFCQTRLQSWILSSLLLHLLPSPPPPPPPQSS